MCVHVAACVSACVSASVSACVSASVSACVSGCMGAPRCVGVYLSVDPDNILLICYINYTHIPVRT